MLYSRGRIRTFWYLPAAPVCTGEQILVYPVHGFLTGEHVEKGSSALQKLSHCSATKTKGFRIPVLGFRAGSSVLVKG